MVNFVCFSLVRKELKGAPVKMCDWAFFFFLERESALQKKKNGRKEGHAKWRRYFLNILICAMPRSILCDHRLLNKQIQIQESKLRAVRLGTIGVRALATLIPRPMRRTTVAGSANLRIIPCCTVRNGKCLFPVSND